LIKHFLDKTWQIRLVKPVTVLVVTQHAGLSKKS
jgi:hypothetical protein